MLLHYLSLNLWYLNIGELYLIRKRNPKIKEPLCSLFKVDWKEQFLYTKIFGECNTRPWKMIWSTNVYPPFPSMICRQIYPEENWGDYQKCRILYSRVDFQEDIPKILLSDLSLLFYIWQKPQQFHRIYLLNDTVKNDTSWGLPHQWNVYLILEKWLS